jgi:hypothetical protein
MTQDYDAVVIGAGVSGCCRRISFRTMQARQTLPACRYTARAGPKNRSTLPASESASSAPARLQSRSSRPLLPRSPT